MYINVNQFRNEYNTQSKRKLTDYAFKEAKVTVDAAKSELIAEFREHPYSQEIAGGEATTNISKSLGGKGNLFSFIGFTQGTQPVDRVVEDLKENVVIRKFAENVTQRGNKTRYQFEVLTPSLKELDERHPMPEWSNLGWLTAIKKGISGFRSYIYWKTFDPEVSRSTTGIQAKKAGKKGEQPQILRSGSFKAAGRYLSDMLADFKKRLTK